MGRYLNSPHSVAKVVLWRSSLASSTPWYPSTQSRVDLSLPAGTVLTISAADLVWWDSCLPTLLRPDRSTVLLGLPFFLGWMTILEHHVSFSPTDFFSKVERNLCRLSAIYAGGIFV